MARSKGEVPFSHRLGSIGENDVAPSLLKILGVVGFSNLNERYMNHPWADYIGKLEGERVAIAVRTRVNWEKTGPGKRPKLKSGMGGSGNLKAEACIRMIRKHEGLAETTNIGLLWLAIAVDLDNTCEAYWGKIDEMRVRPKNNDHLTIWMKPAYRERYTIEGRRLAWRKPVRFLGRTIQTSGHHRLTLGFSNSIQR
jgi:hypothetical protein